MMKTFIPLVAVSLLASACASNAGSLGDQVSAGAYGELSPAWEKAAKTEKKALKLQADAEARILKGEKMIKKSKEMLRDGEKLVEDAQADVKKADRLLADARAKQADIEQKFQKSASDASDAAPSSAQ